MPLTVTFFNFDAGGNERVIRRTVIPDDALVTYQASPAIALSIVQNSGPPRLDGFRITDGRGRVKVTFSQGRGPAKGIETP